MLVMHCFLCVTLNYWSSSKQLLHSVIGVATRTHCTSWSTAMTKTLSRRSKTLIFLAQNSFALFALNLEGRGGLHAFVLDVGLGLNDCLSFFNLVKEQTPNFKDPLLRLPNPIDILNFRDSNFRDPLQQRFNIFSISKME